ncbi:Alpha/Beta hydrolase protein [Parachaetomium inaequale]|uniref:Alpha/Beta hydrolase protein n=1 Tax=Parachaetomium inaequale TaxID=2588326 RepID=A0AAN6PIJ2_9PEZI|nr:Alpha/Beta hydrolase protein [Parachaetomium inaequale]
MANIQPFKIEVPNTELEKLKTKLSLATYPEEVSFSDDPKYGTPLSDIKGLVAYWKDGYDWRKHEARLNQLPHFTTTVDVDGFGKLGIHFLHQKSSRPDAIPLLFCHGWPGGFWEPIKMLALLAEPADAAQPAFHVVVPSLPNFGFSEGVKKPDFGLRQYAETIHKLMLQLNYTKYVSQGGDWGLAITRLLALDYPSHLLASHINFVRAFPPTPLRHPLLYLQSLFHRATPSERAGLARSRAFWRDGAGYNIQQGTRPHTLGFALADSPVALLAWLYEKLRDWTDKNYAWTDDEVLTWASCHAFSRAGAAASVRIYYEAYHGSRAEHERTRRWIGGVRLGFSIFPGDIEVPPALWGRTMGPVVFERVHREGGHFAAWERPEALVGDLRDMFGRDGGARAKI